MLQEQTNEMKVTGKQCLRKGAIQHIVGQRMH